MSPPTVLQVGPLNPTVAESLRAAYDVVVLPAERGAREEVLAAQGPRVRAAAVAFAAPFDRGLIEALPNLGAIAHFGVGYDNIDLDTATEHGVLVANTPDVLTEAVAEVAIGLALDVLHRLSAADRYVRSGRWVAEGTYPLARQLAGRSVGVLGLGRIGRAIAERCTAFGCTVRYHNRRPLDRVGYEYAESPQALAAASDILHVVVPGGGSTDGLVDRGVLEALGPEGVLINVARGTVVDEDALVEMLVDGRLGGAGLDVYTHEPQVPEALMALDSVVLLPHVGSATEETRAAMARLMLDNIRTFLEEGRVLTPVNAR